MRPFQNAYLLSCLLVALLESGGFQWVAVAEDVDVKPAAEEKTEKKPEAVAEDVDEPAAEKNPKKEKEKDDWDLMWSEEQREQRMRACMSAVRRMMKEGYPIYIREMVDEALEKEKKGEKVDKITEYVTAEGQFFALTYDGDDRKITRNSANQAASVAWNIGCYIGIEDKEVVSEMKGHRGINIRTKAHWVRTGVHHTKAEGRTWKLLQALLKDPTANSGSGEL